MSVGPCPVCDHPACDVLYRFPPSDLVPAARELLDELRIGRCQACGMVFSSAVALPAEQIARFYEGDLFESHAYWQGMTEAPATAAPDYHYYAWGLERLGPGEGRRLLDVGCGLGLFLDAARQRGFEVEGTELSDYAAEATRRRCGCPVHVGELELLDLPAHSFDVVAGWDVIEHVRDVRGTLRAMARLLKPGGHLLLRTINEDALVVQLPSWLYRLSGGRLYGPARRVHEIYHLCFFTHANLAKLLADQGLQVRDRMDSDIALPRLGVPKLLWPAIGLLYGLQGLLGRRFEQLVLARAEEVA